MTFDHEKRVAAEAAAELVEDGMTVGLGTGSTVAYLLPALARRALRITCVATSPATERIAAELGMEVAPFAGPASPDRLHIAIDGADQVDPDGWVIKGGGAAHTREKAVAAASDRFIVIVSSDKMVERLAPPVPLELLGVRAERHPGASWAGQAAGGGRSAQTAELSPTTPGRSTTRPRSPLSCRRLSAWSSTDSFPQAWCRR